VGSVSALRDQPKKELKGRIEKILDGPLSQDFQPSQAKTFLYELEMAATFQAAGFHVHLSEPDLVIQGNGLSQRLGVACKYPSSYDQVHRHISKGYSQISRQNISGFVSIGFDLIIGREQLPWSSRQLLDFRTAKAEPLEIMRMLVNQTLKKLMNERKQDYPAEQPLDGALCSLHFYGVSGNPTGLAGPGAWALHSGESSPVRSDIEWVHAKINGLAFGADPVQND
jgi:hypothetical protein